MHKGLNSIVAWRNHSLPSTVSFPLGITTVSVGGVAFIKSLTHVPATSLSQCSKCLIKVYSNDLF